MGDSQREPVAPGIKRKGPVDCSIRPRVLGKEYLDQNTFVSIAGTFEILAAKVTLFRGSLRMKDLSATVPSGLNRLMNFFSELLIDRRSDL
jgi:hypothetical protein